MKPFLFVWNAGQTVILAPTVLGFLDTQQQIKNWFTPYVGTVLLVADDGQTAATLAAVIRAKFPGLLFAVTPVDTRSTDGWMPKVFWDLLREPKSSGRWPSNLEKIAKALAESYGPTKKQEPVPGSLADLLNYGKQKK